MQDYEKLGVFYLGRVDGGTNELVLYDSKDLVTHAVCVGMTGSGKTGLCIDLLEEAAIDGIPAIVIDPKGDLGNLLLQFPELKPEDFAPWITDDQARAAGVTKEQFAAEQAKTWREGLAKWDESGERNKRLQDSAEFSIYTPGSTAGLPLSILRSFAAPEPAVLSDAELMRDKVSGTATAVLSLAGVQAEPMKSREHILLSALFQRAWAAGEDLDLAGLIQQIQSPPLTRVGVMDVESFFPAKDRFELAMTLNNLLAAPGFEVWMQGEPLDIGRLLHSPEGKPRISILHIAHLSESERMFAVSLILNEMLSWMRTQPGTTSLRALLYMDEIFGYFPPVANPPSKRPLLTLLKQARAFGVGIVLATQNPVDLDYKGLSNCGTWFIGRLQTERDKNRLLDGLIGAADEGGAHMDRAEIDQMLSGLGKRRFLMNNVHEHAPVVFESRWALSYLRGPLTRSEIKSLTDARRPAATTEAKRPVQVASATAPVSPSAAAPVVLPPTIPQVFLPVRGSAERATYVPMLLAVAQTRFTDKKTGVDEAVDKAFLTAIKDESVPVHWEDSFEVEVPTSDLEKTPEPGAAFAALAPAATKAKSYASWNKELIAWLYGTQCCSLFHSGSLDQYSHPGESERDFRIRLQQAAREERDRASADIRRRYAPKIAAMEERLRKAEQAVAREQQQAQAQTFQTVLSVGSGLLGAFLGRKVVSKSTLSSATQAARAMSRTYKERQDVDRYGESVEAVQRQLGDLNSQFEEEVAALSSRIDPATEQFETVAVKPKKTGITVRLLTLCWAPYVEEAGQMKPAWE
jgi:hypothetical protein